MKIIFIQVTEMVKGLKFKVVVEFTTRHERIIADVTNNSVNNDYCLSFSFLNYCLSSTKNCHYNWPFTAIVLDDNTNKSMMKIAEDGNSQTCRMIDQS